MPTVDENGQVAHWFMCVCLCFLCGVLAVRWVKQVTVSIAAAVHQQIEEKENEELSCAFIN